MSSEELAEQMETLFARFAGQMLSTDRNYFTRGVINLPQVFVLRYLADAGPCSMRSLSTALNIKASTLTGIVDRLLALGLVRRQPAAKDRRKVIAEATSKGRRILAHIRAERKRRLAAMFNAISAEERSIYMAIMKKIAATLPSQLQS